MIKKKKEFIALALIVILALGLLPSCGASGDQSSGDGSSPSAAAHDQNSEGGSSGASGPSGSEAWHFSEDGGSIIPTKKTETVTATADATGRIKDITSSVQLSTKGSSLSLPIRDISSLTDIKNKAGAEEFEIQDDTIYWENLGENIEYEGKSSASLPVIVSFKYELNGSDISPEELAGKSGNIKIRIDYANRTSVPFACITALFFPENVLSNVEVENGSLTSISSQDTILGLTFPGLKSALFPEGDDSSSDPDSSGADDEDKKFGEDVDIPDFIEITAYANKFEMDFSTTLVQNGILEDMEDSDDIEEMADSMDELMDATNSLIDGSWKLLDGQRSLNSGVSQYLSGVTGVRDGMYSVADGIYQLALQNNTLTTGAANLADGLYSASAYIPQIEASLPSSLSEEERGQIIGMLEGLKSSMDTLVEGGYSLSSGISAYTGAVSQLNDGANQVYAGANTLVEQSGNITSGLSSMESGIQSLYNGLVAYRDEGIAELSSLVKDDLLGLDSRIKELKTKDTEYSSFSGKDEKTEGSVMFIIETEEIKK